MRSLRAGWESTWNERPTDALKSRVKSKQVGCIDKGITGTSLMALLW